jgi:hypothetical protein
VTDRFALLYVSTATRRVGVARIEQLLERAQVQNAHAGLTGLRLFDGGFFMQYVEGSAAAIGRVYRRIRGSWLHSGIVALLREFPEWWIAFRSVNAVGMSPPAPLSERLDPLHGAGAEPGSAARTILGKFWNRGRASHAF